MEPKRPSIPIQLQAFRRHSRKRPHWPWPLDAKCAPAASSGHRKAQPLSVMTGCDKGTGLTYNNYLFIFNV